LVACRVQQQAVDIGQLPRKRLPTARQSPGDQSEAEEQRAVVRIESFIINGEMLTIRNIEDAGPAP
jgi:hypothetical protein